MYIQSSRREREHTSPWSESLNVLWKFGQFNVRFFWIFGKFSRLKILFFWDIGYKYNLLTDTNCKLASKPLPGAPRTFKTLLEDAEFAFDTPRPSNHQKRLKT